jgi:outer membrane protein assembly factor BamB
MRLREDPPAWPCMRSSRSVRAAAVALALGLGALGFATSPRSAQPVLQRGYDAGVSGATLSETTLNTTNVSPNTFGLVFRLSLDDSVFAQPLYVPGVAIQNRGIHNVVYVATMSDTLYAFDADTGGAPLWSVNLASLVGASPVPMARFAFSGDRNIVGNLGILSTPVIDPSTHVMYLVACTLEGGTMVYRLHALDITSGAELYVPGGTMISGSYGGSIFDARYQTQRVSLALSGNQVVFGFGAV